MVKQKTFLLLACLAWCIAVFYTGIRTSLFLAGVLFGYQFLKVQRR